MPESLSKIPSGMRYHFGAEARLRRVAEAEAMAVFGGWGYSEIATPAVDYYALFERGMGREEARRAFRFTDADGRLLALRPDVTSSVARAAATLFADSPRPLRFCYAESVFHQRPRSHAEWRRQGRQIGCELIGSGAAAAEMEVLAVAAEALERLGLGGSYKITLNHVGVFNGVAEQLGLVAEGRERLRQLVDFRDTAGLEQFVSRQVPHEQAESPACGLVRLAGKGELLRKARAVITNARSREALDEVGELWAVVESLGLGEHFDIDLADVSGLDYYTGLVFKIYVEGAGGRVGGGGRYDELTASFGGREPAVGFVLDLDALADVLAKENGEVKDGGARGAAPVSGASAVALFVEARARRARGEHVRLSLDVK